LFKATAPDFSPLYTRVKADIERDGEIPAGAVLPTENEYPPSI
jgi:DNA-binding GntR family transcriptional regulator